MEKMQNDTRKPDSVPYIVYESEQMRSEARDKRHWIGHIVSLVVIIAIVAGFLLYLNQYEYVSNETVTVDGKTGVANYIGKDGDIYNGKNYGEAYPISGEEVGAEQGNP